MHTRFTPAVAAACDAAGMVMCTSYNQPADTETGLIGGAGAADDQHVFDLNVRLQYSDDPVVLTQALQVMHGATALSSTCCMAGCCMFACTFA